MSGPAKTSHAERAYEYLCSTKLVDPQFHGTFLSELEVAQALGISRTPVREALRRLSSEGLIEQIPNRGSFIPKPERSSVRDLFELREALETYAARKCIAEGREAAVGMRESLRAQELMVRDKPEFTHADELTFIERDRNFHTALLAATGNREMAASYARLETRQRALGAQALASPLRRAEVCVEHEAILAALENNDVDAACRAITEHLRVTQELLLAG